MRRLIFAMAVVSVQASAFAQAPMQFQAFPPNRMPEVLMGDHAWIIYASGDIDDKADQRLENVIRRNNIPLGSRLYLHSPGGNMFGGMKLGRAIRRHLLLTDVGQIDPKETDRHGSMPGKCYSACAMAFLGGEFRFLGKGSVYGVHRFFWEKPTAFDADRAQMMSAIIVEYIRSMDVNTDLFGVAAQAGREEVMTPSREELVRLNVINNGTKKVKWTIESIPEGIYLKGERETWNGINKFIISCRAHRAIALYIIFDPGKNADDVNDAETVKTDQDCMVPLNRAPAGPPMMVGNSIDLLRLTPKNLFERLFDLTVQLLEQERIRLCVHRLVQGLVDLLRWAPISANPEVIAAYLRRSGVEERIAAHA